MRRFILLCFALALPLFAAEIPAVDDKPISVEFPFMSKYVNVLGSNMHYVDEGSGDPILFLHGNPTSMYLWRNIMPYLTEKGRVVAVDNIGFGFSDKPDIDYTFADHAAYLRAFIDVLDLRNITLVIHDWGSALGFDYAAAFPDNVKAIVFMEAILPTISDTITNGPGGPLFAQMRDPIQGWSFLIRRNGFIEDILPGNILREMTHTEMQHYRRPFLLEADRKPLWVWPLQVPINGVPAETHAVVQNYGAWLSRTDTPMLMFAVTPGAIGPGEAVAWSREHIDNLRVFHLGPGLHFIQEDYPHTIGRLTARFVDSLP
ncbi:haloalkane dehalogenase [Acanthopleuribacter pedis]|uniref:Haloalkane dehalogenase n=1 Tax=Acanthopleuribacter pedis TaxID=442870 RepID=A0A8J7QD74_9BACT|nr:haloalkane dehalogenase [Acanthopleuribacter pedis]MBO1322377.1 haloalkane dehalogenase [Acanthopleuribacter pedis]